MIASFVDIKSGQLCFFLRGFWNEEIPHSELEIFFWDTLEEWSQVNYSLEQPYSAQERVFWHLLHQIQFWAEETLRNNHLLVEELSYCLDFLEGQGVCPMDCIGIRP